MSNKPRYENTRVAFTVADSLRKVIEDKVAAAHTRQTQKLTDINLKTSVEIFTSVIIANPPWNPSWPANGSLLITLSAHNRTEWLRENLPTMKRFEFLVIKPRCAQPLDLQLRWGDLLVANVETELGGERAQRHDHEKLTTHLELPMFSMFFCREKSFKNIDHRFRSLQTSSKSRQEPFINIIQHWPDGTMLCVSTTYVTVTQRGKLLYKLEPLMVK